MEAGRKFEVEVEVVVVRETRRGRESASRGAKTD